MGGKNSKRGLRAKRRQRLTRQKNLKRSKSLKRSKQELKVTSDEPLVQSEVVQLTPGQPMTVTVPAGCTEVAIAGQPKVQVPAGCTEVTVLVPEPFKMQDKPAINQLASLSWD